MKLYYWPFVCFAAFLVSCAEKQEEGDIISQHTIVQSHKADSTYACIYSGVLPCNGCEGIQTTIRISADYQTYVMNKIYLGKDLSENTSGMLNTERGFENDRNATLFVLDADKPRQEQQYFVRLTDDPVNGYMLDSHMTLLAQNPLKRMWW
ncbi:MAG: copper resistance protein NlpE N-terminal domain-containing protein [Cytophagaceae bacterium]